MFFRCILILAGICLTCLWDTAVSSSVPAISAVLPVEHLGYLCEVPRTRWVGESSLSKAMLLPFSCIDSSPVSLFGTVVHTWQAAATRLLTFADGRLSLTLAGEGRNLRQWHLQECVVLAGAAGLAPSLGTHALLECGDEEARCPLAWQN